MSSYNHHLLRSVMNDCTPLFPRQFRCAHSDQVRETVKDARIDARRALNARKDTLEIEHARAIRKSINDSYEAAIDVQLTEIARYIGPLTAQKDTAQ